MQNDGTRRGDVIHTTRALGESTQILDAPDLNDAHAVHLAEIRFKGWQTWFLLVDRLRLGLGLLDNPLRLRLHA